MKNDDKDIVEDDKDVFPQASLFIADVLTWNPKGERHSMEHPFFSLSKNKDTKDRRYETADGKVILEIMPTSKGIPTIWDKDLLIYVCTLVREGMNRGTIGDVNVPIRIDAYNYFSATGKGKGSQQYKGMMDTLDRLRGTAIKTTIQSGGMTYTEGFSLIDKYRVSARTDAGKIRSVDIKLCDWLWGAIKNAAMEMLTINQEYFALSSGIDRRLYELARKHCGNQPQWKVKVETLWKKSGSMSSLREFRRILFERQADLGNLPDYRIQINEKDDSLTFFSRTGARIVEMVKDVKESMQSKKN